MISVQDAYNIVLDNAHSLGSEQVSLIDSIGRVLTEDIIADRAVPPFDRVTMDGIAIQYDAYEDGQRIFEIEAMGPAGAPQVTLQSTNKCIEIMTGAILPIGTDTVIRYEDLEQLDNSFKINEDIIRAKNVHFRGSDYPQGEILLKSGQLIKAIHINVLASVGKTNVKVARLPKVAVISTGDELVEIDQVPLEHQIRKSNVYMLAARLKELQVPHEIFHFQDDTDDISSAIKSLSEQYDVLMMSGGVSKGKFDFVPQVLDDLGFEKLFHRVAQRPGKPFWFGIKDRVRVFAFPGNPVSTLACFHKYFVPWLYKIQNLDYSPIEVVLDNDIVFAPALDYFAQAKIVHQGNGLTKVVVRHGNGSGDIVSPITMDGFLELPADINDFKRGEIYPFIPFYPLNK